MFETDDKIWLSRVKLPPLPPTLPTRHKVTELERYRRGKKDMYNPERHALEKVMVKWSKVELHKGQGAEDK